MKQLSFYLHAEVVDDYGQTRVMRANREMKVTSPESHDQAIALFNTHLDHWCQDVEKFVGE